MGVLLAAAAVQVVIEQQRIFRSHPKLMLLLLVLAVRAVGLVVIGVALELVQSLLRAAILYFHPLHQRAAAQDSLKQGQELRVVLVAVVQLQLEASQI